MSKVAVSIDIEAEADRVWALIGGFDSLPQWLPMIRKSSAADGGRVRRLEARNGAIIVERLLRFDEAGRGYSYCHLEAPDPVTDYVGELRVEPLADGNSKVTWSSSFTPAGIPEAEAIAHYERIYGEGLGELKKRLEA